jgi:hypothetical protein
MIWGVIKRGNRFILKKVLKWIGIILNSYSTEGDFIEFFRTGVTPNNKPVNPEYMPWEHFGLMTDEELSAIYEYLNLLP